MHTLIARAGLIVIGCAVVTAVSAAPVPKRWRATHLSRPLRQPVPPVKPIIVKPAVLESAPTPVVVGYYVTPTGAGSHNGTSANPFSLAEAQVLARERPAEELTFVLAAGEYGRFEEKASRSAWVTYQAADQVDRPIFRGNGIYPAVHLHGAQSLYVRLVGIGAYAGTESAIEIERAGQVAISQSLIQGVRAQAIVGYALSVSYSSGIVIERSTIRHGTNGVSVNSVTNFTLSGNDIGYALVDGLHIGDAEGSLFSGNFIHDVAVPTGIYPEAHQDSLQIDAGSGGVRNVRIVANTFRNSAGQGVFIAKSGHNQAYVIDSIIFADNGITGSYGASAFQVEGSNLVITGNTINATSPFVSALLETASRVTLSNNVFNGKFVNCAESSTQSGNTFETLLPCRP